MDHVALISYHPPLLPGAPAHEVWLLYHYATALAQQGCRVWWVTTTDTAAILAHGTCPVALSVTAFPSTCRYVVPGQAYDLASLQLFCIESTVWQDPALHTRLFTFLHLLQRALPAALWHAWGRAPAPYLTVYTARFLGLPVIVSYSPAALREETPEPFLWQWVAQSTSLAWVFSQTDRERLLATSGTTPDKLQVVQPELPALLAAGLAFYQQIRSARDTDCC